MLPQLFKHYKITRPWEKADKENIHQTNNINKFYICFSARYDKVCSKADNNIYNINKIPKLLLRKVLHYKSPDELMHHMIHVMHSVMSLWGRERDRIRFSIFVTVILYQHSKH